MIHTKECTGAVNITPVTLCLVFWKVKAREGRTAFKLERFSYYNLAIKIALGLMVLVTCLEYPEEMTGWQVPLFPPPDSALLQTFSAVGLVFFVDLQILIRDPFSYLFPCTPLKWFLVLR